MALLPLSNPLTLGSRLVTIKYFVVIIVVLLGIMFGGFYYFKFHTEQLKRKIDTQKVELDLFKSQQKADQEHRAQIEQQYAELKSKNDELDRQMASFAKKLSGLKANPVNKKYLDEKVPSDVINAFNSDD